MAEYKGILILGELADGKLAAIATELLGCGRRLADELKQDLSCLLSGDKVGDAAKDAVAFGADKVYVADHSLLRDYEADAYMQVAGRLVDEITPRAILMGQTFMGRDFAPRLAFKLGTSVVTDCLDLTVDPQTRLLVQTKPVYGSNAQAVLTGQKAPQVVTVRSKAMSSLERDISRKGEVISYKVDIDTSKMRTKTLETIKEEAVGIKLEDAPVIVCGGRGIGGPQPFQTTLKELADLLHGAVGASRPPADNGWVSEALHIGLTGKIVAPDIYFAIAVSGASQHTAGCSSSKHIIAINKDPEANIFREAEFGVVGKYEEVVPALTKKLRELLSA